MLKARAPRTVLFAAALLTGFVSMTPPRAHAANKDIIELQTQVQQLLDMVQRLQSTLDSRFGVLQHLVEQTADQTNRMTSAVNDLQQKVAAQDAAISGKIDTNAGQVQSVSDSVEELKARLDKLQQSVNGLQTQLQTIQTPPQPAPGATGQPGQPGQQPAGPGTGMGAGGGGNAGPAANAAPPLQDTYQSAMRDFDGAHYDVAQGEFQEIIQYYPQDDLAGNAQYYLGEIAYRQGDWENAVKAYKAMLENFTTGSKAPAAELHEGLALLKLNRRSEGIRELRALVARHPHTPEAAQARSRLNGLHAGA